MKSILSRSAVLVFLIFAGCQSAQEPGEEITEEVILQKLYDQSRFLRPEELAQKMINGDPNLLMIDVRDHASFDAFSLPGAINIPFDSLRQASSLAQMDCARYDLVFLSNDGFLADQAWYFQILRACKKAYVLEGGFNNWVASLLQPKQPAPTATEEELNQYQLRLAIRQYFLGGSKELEAIPYQPAETAPPKKIEVKAKPVIKPAKQEEEGC